MDLVSGGWEFDGKTAISKIIEKEILAVVEKLKERKIKNVAVCGVFSQVNASQELEVNLTDLLFMSEINNMFCFLKI